jgi:hypothetical protein
MLLYLSGFGHFLQCGGSHNASSAVLPDDVVAKLDALRADEYVVWALYQGVSLTA